MSRGGGSVQAKDLGVSQGSPCQDVLETHTVLSRQRHSLSSARTKQPALGDNRSRKGPGSPPGRPWQVPPRSAPKGLQQEFLTSLEYAPC